MKKKSVLSLLLAAALFGLAGLLGGALILAGIVVSCWPQKTGG